MRCQATLFSVGIGGWLRRSSADPGSVPILAAPGFYRKWRLSWFVLRENRGWGYDPGFSVDWTE